MSEQLHPEFGAITILDEAKQLVNDDRRKDYGHPKQNFKDIADMWSVILDKRVEPLQVIQCMIALKLCRANQGYKKDTFTDIAGYSLCAELIQ